MTVIDPVKISGEINAPPSKSVLIRAIAIAVLKKGTTAILASSLCDDVRSALKISIGLGAKVRYMDKGVEIEGSKGPLLSKIDCGESGLALRLFSVLAAKFPSPIELFPSGSLNTRPMDMICDPIKKLGASCVSNNGFAPIKIQGPINGGNIEVDGSQTSQVVSGLLITLPFCERGSEVIVKNPVSSPYLDLTVSVLKDFGIKIDHDESYTRFVIEGGQAPDKETFHVEGDWSGAAFFLVAGATAGKVKVTGLNLESKQADIKILKGLKQCGAKIILGKNSVTVTKERLKGFDFDATQCPDLFPPLVALAVNCKGVTNIKGVKRLLTKESNRADTLISEFSKLKIAMDVKGDVMKIKGGEISSGHVDSHNDHRIAMALIIAAVSSREYISFGNCQAVSKSYPGFLYDLQTINEGRQ